MKYRSLMPVIGIIIFAALYIIATQVYSGGSQLDKYATGFSWKNSYWCNLLNENAINGQHNRARPVAVTAMIILCMALTFFWWSFPVQINFKRYGRLTIQIAGTASMVTALFLFTDIHDIIIIIASVFGLIALIGTLMGLYKVRLNYLFIMGLFNIILVALNNYFYYSKGLLVYLPVIQKISLAFFLLWICCISIILYKRQAC